MITRLVQVTAPTQEPVTAADMAAHSRIDVDDEDLLNVYIKAARQWCEAYTRRAFITQTWDAYFDYWPASPVYLPLPPLQSVTSWKYTDDAGATSTWASTNYLVSAGSPGRVFVTTDATFPSVTLQEADGVVIRFVCGYGNAPNATPENVRQAIRLLTAHLYENREPTITGTIITPVQFSLEALLYPSRYWVKQ